MRKLYGQPRGPYLYRPAVRLSGLGDNVVGQVSPDGLYSWNGRDWSPVGASATPVVYNAPAAPTLMPVGAWPDAAVVLRNQDLEASYQQAIGVQQADTDYERCIANGTDAGTCRARWPVEYSGEVPYLNLTPTQQAGAMMTTDQVAAQVGANAVATQQAIAADFVRAGLQPPPALNLKPNQSVPPTTPLLPMKTGIQNTGAVLQAQQNSGTTVVDTPAPSSNTLLIVAAVGLGLYLVIGSKS